MEAPGVAFIDGQFLNFLRDARFWPKLLIDNTFDADTESSWIPRRDPKSTNFLETLWRRREQCPMLRRRDASRPLQMSSERRRECSRTPPKLDRDGASSGNVQGGMMNHPTIMPKTKVALTLDAALIEQVDELVERRRFRNRSQAVEAALADKLRRLARTRLATESAKLNPREEKRLADEGLAEDVAAWPEY
jgi:Arc/MetJ-type ribon-helix-helix transcriptional regulator